MLTTVCRKFFFLFLFFLPCPLWDLMAFVCIGTYTHIQRTFPYEKKKKFSAKCHQQFNAIWQESLCAWLHLVVSSVIKCHASNALIWDIPWPLTFERRAEVQNQLHHDESYPCEVIGSWNTWYGEQDQAGECHLFKKLKQILSSHQWILLYDELLKEVLNKRLQQ